MTKLRLNPTCFIVAATLFFTACVRKVTVPEVLPVKAPVSTGELVERINSYRDVTSFAAKAGVKVQDYYTGEADKAKVFPEVNGALRLQRPEKIRLLISAPFLGKDIADMTSDGNEFRLAVFWPDDKRMFVKGTNPAEYQRLNAEELRTTNDPRLKEAGAIANMRPQHITDAFIIRPINLGDRTEFFREDVRQTEPDTRVGKKGRMVERTYYVLFVLERNDQNRLVLKRKFWFDRTQDGTPLARQQTFDNGEGRLGTDVFYSGFFQVSNSDRLWAEQLRVERPNDGYGMRIFIERDSVEVNLELPPTTFVLENTRRLKEVNLDEVNRTPATQTGAGQAPTRRPG